MVGTTREGPNQMQGIPLPQTAAGEGLGKSEVPGIKGGFAHCHVS